jgi:putative ABC transport system ATP-binding protein
VILADEPTGNLDPGTAHQIMGLLTEQVRAHGSSLVLVTHSQAATLHAHRVLKLEADGLRPL